MKEKEKGMKKFIAAALAALMLSSFAGCANTAEEPKNETYIYGQVDSVSGNDIVLLLAEYNGEVTSGEDTDSSEDGEGGKESDDSGSEKSKRSGRPGSGEKPEGFTRPENSEMPEGFDPSNFSGEMPEGSGSKRSSKSSGSSSKFTLTGEQEELRIPVGTTVTTSLGVETDFKVIEAGNMIRCSVEKNSDGEDVITAVMIMEN